MFNTNCIVITNHSNINQMHETIYRTKKLSNITFHFWNLLFNRIQRYNPFKIITFVIMKVSYTARTDWQVIVQILSAKYTIHNTAVREHVAVTSRSLDFSVGTSRCISSKNITRIYYRRKYYTNHKIWKLLIPFCFISDYRNVVFKSFSVLILATLTHDPQATGL